jgi:hypothetical protein
MRVLLVCTALCAAWPSTLLASTDLASTEIPATATTFAYGGRHSVLELPSAAMTALRPTENTPVPQGAADMATAGTDAADTAKESPVAQVQKATRVFSRSELCTAAASVAEANNLPVPFFTNLIQQESGFKPHVVSPAGAQGIAQFMPRVAAAYGLTNPFDPIHALAVSGRFLRELFQQFGNNLGLAAAAYNAGPGRVGNWLNKKGKLPAETRTYVRNITGQPAEHWVRNKPKADEVRLPMHARCPELQVMEARAAQPLLPAHAVSETVAAAPVANQYTVASTRGRTRYVLASAPVARKSLGHKTIVIGMASVKHKSLTHKAIAVAAVQPAKSMVHQPKQMAAVAQPRMPRGKASAVAIAAASRDKVNTTIMAPEKREARKAAHSKLASAQPAPKGAAAKPAAVKSAAAKPATGHAAKGVKVAAR